MGFFKESLSKSLVKLDDVVLVTVGAILVALEEDEVIETFDENIVERDEQESFVSRGVGRAGGWSKSLAFDPDLDLVSCKIWHHLNY